MDEHDAKTLIAVEGNVARLGQNQAKLPTLYNPDGVKLAPARRVSIAEWEASK